MILPSIDLVNLLTTAGYAGIFLIVAAESGMGIGFFLPGDSLLITAGFLASRGILDIYLVCALSFIAAVLGDSVGYSIGKKIGPKLFTSNKGLVFTLENLDRAHDFYARHGSKTIVIARFLPFFRAFVPILAGITHMRYKKFLTYNILGGIIWAIGIPVTGLVLGARIPNIDSYILPIILAIIVLSVLPGVIKLIHAWLKKRRSR